MPSLGICGLWVEGGSKFQLILTGSPTPDSRWRRERSSRNVSSTTATYSLKRTGAITQPCRRLLSTWIGSEHPLTTLTVATTSSREDFSTLNTSSSRTPQFARAIHNAVRGTGSYSFLRSMKIENSHGVYKRSLVPVEYRIQHQDTPPPPTNKKPHCDWGTSFSTTDLSLFWMILPQSFPTSRNAIPRQLSHWRKSPFLGTGTKLAWYRSCGAYDCVHTPCSKSARATRKHKPPPFSNSLTIPDVPPDFPLDMARKAVWGSSAPGGGQKA